MDYKKLCGPITLQAPPFKPFLPVTYHGSPSGGCVGHPVGAKHLPTRTPCTPKTKALFRGGGYNSFIFIVIPKVP